jgi:hypothetical protein
VNELFRRTPEGIALDLPEPLRSWLVTMAQEATDDAVRVDGPVHRRLLGPINPAADHDDPLSELQRQFEVEGALTIFIQTAHHELLSEEQAEQWIRALQLMLTATAARLAIRTEEDLAQLDEEATATVATFQDAISLLIDALDG